VSRLRWHGGSTQPGEKLDNRLIGGAVFFGLLASSPFWFGALIWSATAVRREPPPTPATRRVPPASPPQQPDDEEIPVYEIPDPPRRSRR
jgi:hypothetical protein